MKYVKAAGAFTGKLLILAAFAVGILLLIADAPAAEPVPTALETAVKNSQQDIKAADAALKYQMDRTKQRLETSWFAFKAAVETKVTAAVKVAEPTLVRTVEAATAAEVAKRQTASAAMEVVTDITSAVMTPTPNPSPGTVTTTP